MSCTKPNACAEECFTAKIEDKGGAELDSRFDRVISREKTASIKWDGRKQKFGRDDVIPMWVADMDFASPECVIEALHNRVRHGVFGYTVRDDAFNEAVVGWLLRRHQWTIQPEWVSQASGVVPALNYLIQALTEPGDGIIIQPPVYHPFARLIKSHHRQLLTNPLQERAGKYVMDYADLEAKAAAGAKLLILCSPHNPVGRVWTREELERAGEICLRHGVTVIADEIHSDLVYAPHRHTPFASISKDFSMNSVTTLAPSKTFNVAGLNTALVVAEREDLRTRYRDMIQLQSAGSINVLGAQALKAAYSGGDAWLDDLLRYLAGNIDYLKSQLQSLAPRVRVTDTEGTYLVWLDFRELGMTPEQLKEWLVHEVGLGLESGETYGEEGVGFQRINVGCPRSVLEEAVQRLLKGVKSLDK